MMHGFITVNHLLIIVILIGALVLLNAGNMEFMRPASFVDMGNYPGTIFAGNPDTVGFPILQTDASQFRYLEMGDLVEVHGSFYAYQDPSDQGACERIGGTVKSSGSFAGSCLLNGAIGSIDYIKDDIGNVYHVASYRSGYLYVPYQGYEPKGMTWYMKTSEAGQSPSITGDVVTNSQDPFHDPVWPEKPRTVFDVLAGAIADFFNSILSMFGWGPLS